MPEGEVPGAAPRSSTGNCATSRLKTIDCGKVELMMNAGLAVDLPQLDESGAAGSVSSARNLQFMVGGGGGDFSARRSAGEALSRGDPRRRRQASHLPHDRYRGRQGAALFQGRRTGRKPGLGWRAIRLALDRPALLRTQFRALLKASGGRELKIMLPMVTEIHEIKQSARVARPRGGRPVGACTPHLPDRLNSVR